MPNALEVRLNRPTGVGDGPGADCADDGEADIGLTSVEGTPTADAGAAWEGKPPVGLALG